uniref:Uncharacterized protein n=1 Tax=Fagus sylvatica TaxID=28930 RepID=A0A2N9H9M8_FAGSY
MTHFSMMRISPYSLGSNDALSMACWQNPALDVHLVSLSFLHTMSASTQEPTSLHSTLEAYSDIGPGILLPLPCFLGDSFLESIYNENLVFLSLKPKNQLLSEPASLLNVVVTCDNRVCRARAPGPSNKKLWKLWELWEEM